MAYGHIANMEVVDELVVSPDGPKKVYKSWKRIRTAEVEESSRKAEGDSSIPSDQ